MPLVEAGYVEGRNVNIEYRCKASSTGFETEWRGRLV
jgi:hypothetical protein